MHAHTSCVEINMRYFSAFLQISGKESSPWVLSKSHMLPCSHRARLEHKLQKGTHCTPARSQGLGAEHTAGAIQVLVAERKEPQLLQTYSCRKIFSARRKSKSPYFKLFCRTGKIRAISELLLCDTSINPSLNSANHQCPHTICSNRFCHLLLSWFPVCASMPQSMLQRPLNSLSPVHTTLLHRRKEICMVSMRASANHCVVFTLMLGL